MGLLFISLKRGNEMGNVSYCDDCIHLLVCKYVKQVKEYEGKAPIVVSTVVGPIVTFSIKCAYKDVRGEVK